MLSEEVPRSRTFALFAVVVAGGRKVPVDAGGRKVPVDAGGRVAVIAGGGTKVAIVEFVATALMMSSVG